MIDVQKAAALGISRREQRLAENIARQFPSLMTRRRLVPAITGFSLTNFDKLSILIVVLDIHKIGDHSPYVNPDLLHQFSTDMGGLRVYLSNSTGLRYVILLSPLPKLPRKVELPGDIPRGKIALGLSFTFRPLLMNWEQLRHIAVLGQTGSGKSVFLRSLVHQAIRDDMQLLLADIDQTTFSMWKEHPNLLAPIASKPAEALDLVRQALGECDYRAILYRSMPGHPEKLSEYNALAVKQGQDPLPRILVVLDEASAVLSVMGGGKGEFGQALATLGWRGRKFGVHFIFGAQEFTKDLVGPVRDQVGLSVCFRVRSEEMSKRMGCAGASRIPEGRPGLAITDRFGPMQAYFVEKSALVSNTNLLPALSDIEISLFTRALAEGGKLPAARVQEWANVSEWGARRRLEDWALKGWVAKDASRDNAFCLTERIEKLLLSLSNHQPAQSGSSPLEPSQS
jgi:hypothetical protein